jgi:assimilatory nitrate reductase catalytic subunit
VAALGRRLLSPSAKAPQGFTPRGRIVCTCLNVAETEIRQALALLSGSTESVLAGLQEKLKCGTGCGSCIPELRKMVAMSLPMPMPLPVATVA